MSNQRTGLKHKYKKYCKYTCSKQLIIYRLHCNNDDIKVKQNNTSLSIKNDCSHRIHNKIFLHLWNIKIAGNISIITRIERGRQRGREGDREGERRERERERERRERERERERQRQRQRERQKEGEGASNVHTHLFHRHSFPPVIEILTESLAFYKSDKWRGGHGVVRRISSPREFSLVF